MTNTRHRDRRKQATSFAAMAALVVAFTVGGPAAAATTDLEPTKMTSSAVTPKQQSIAPVGGAAAIGDMPRLRASLEQGLDAGLTISDAKEILVQMYAYAGFPRSLNALGELMKVVEARKQRGLQDAPGRDPRPVPSGKELLAVGTANQTKLSGAPVKGALFDFAPAVDEYLKTHLFGDIFARDNFDWQSRELATVGALSALAGVESQLDAHIRISMNMGLTAAQLRSVADGLATSGLVDAAARLRSALDKL